MNRKNHFYGPLIIIVLLISIGILGVNWASTYKNNREDKNLNSSYYDYSINYLRTDRDVYYSNETIMINASWDLIQEEPKLGDNITYMQLRIYENELIWSSEEFHQLGDNIQHNFSIPLQNILNLTGESTELTLTIYHYKEEDFGESISEAYLGNQTLEVIRICRVNNIELDINRDFLFPGDHIVIAMSWDSFYDPNYESSYIQLQIYNSTNTLLWNSSKIFEKGANCTRIFNISISELKPKPSDHEEVLLITCFYYYNSLIRPISQSCYFANQTITFLKGGYINNISLKINQGEFYYNEKVVIAMSWDSFYDPNYESSYIQLQIYNSTNTLLWNSSKIFEKGANCTRIFNISISELKPKPSDHEEVLLITCFYYYNSLIRPISQSCYFANQTLIISINDSSDIQKYQRNGLIILTLGSTFSSLGLFSAIIILFLISKKKKKYVKDIIIEY